MTGEQVSEVVVETVEPVVVEPELPADRPHLHVTGVLDGQTIGVLQWVLGVKQSKVLDEKTLKAVQKRLGVTQTGAFDRELRQAWQLHLGVPVATTFDSRSVKALQVWLAEATTW